MVEASDLWPPFGLVVRAGDLRLTPVADDDLTGLVELALAGIHDPDWMPFDVPWTLAPPEELPRRYAQHYWEVRAAFRPDDFTLDFAVRHDGQLVGVQGFAARDFPILRTAETGSWLGAAFQGHGIGTRMRQAVCAFLFDVLGATQVCSAAYVDNPASLAVSRKVGYRDDGTVRKNRQGAPVDSRRLLLDPEAFVRGVPIEVTGSEPLRAFLGVA
jgi:RimJ/RimL family protein N-acetyltransferase